MSDDLYTRAEKELTKHGSAEEYLEAALERLDSAEDHLCREIEHGLAVTKERDALRVEAASLRNQNERLLNMLELALKATL